MCIHIADPLHCIAETNATSSSNYCVVQLPSCVWLFATPWTAASESSLSLTISQSLPTFMAIASVIPSSHLSLWCPLLLLPSIFPSIRNFSNESAVHIRWPWYWIFNFKLSMILLKKKKLPELLFLSTLNFLYTSIQHGSHFTWQRIYSFMSPSLD